MTLPPTGTTDPVAFAAEFGMGLRHFRATRRMSVDELGMLLGVSGNYIYMMERGKLAPAQTVQERFTVLCTTSDIYAVGAIPGVRERDIAIISWAQAGRATSYEQMAPDWDDATRCACPDQEAFGIRLVGDSMEPVYHEGEVVVVMPNCVAKSGCLVVARFSAGDGVVFKQFTTSKSRPHRFKLSSFNRQYHACEFTWDQVHWVYPVFSARERTTKHGK